MPQLRLHLRNEWGSLQRVLGLLTRKRLTIHAVQANLTGDGWQVRMGLAEPTPIATALLSHLRKMQNVVSAELGAEPRQESTTEDQK